MEQPRKDGTTVWTEVTAGGVYDGEDRFVSILGVSQDISDRRYAESALRTSEERFMALFENSHLGTFIIDLDGQFLESNQLFCDMLGYEMDELNRANMSEVTDPPVEMKRSAAVRRLLAQNLGNTDTESDFKRKDGKVRNARMSLSVLKDRNGVERHLLGMVHDVTVKKDTEDVVAESERRFRTLFQNTPLAITISGLEGEIVETNEQFARMMGYPSAELKGLNIYALQTPHIKAEDSELVNSLLNHKVDKANVDRQWVRKDGSLWWGHVVGSLLYDDQGNPKHILAAERFLPDR